MGVFTVVLRTGFCLWAVQYGVLAVAVAITAFEFVVLPLRFYLINRQMRLDFPGYIRSIAPAAVATLLMAICVVAVHFITRHMNPVGAIILLVAVGVASYSAALFAVARPSLRLVVGALRR